VHALETRLCKETGGIAGIECSLEQPGRQSDHYTKFGSAPGDDRPIFTRCCKIFLTSAGSVITAITFMGEEQGRHSRANGQESVRVSFLNCNRHLEPPFRHLVVALKNRVLGGNRLCVHRMILQLVSVAFFPARSLSSSLRNILRYYLCVFQASANFVSMSTPLVIARNNLFTLIVAPVK